MLTHEKLVCQSIHFMKGCFHLKVIFNNKGMVHMAGTEADKGTHSHSLVQAGTQQVVLR